MPWEHAAEARAALNAIVTDPDHGVQVLSSPRTMSNLLKDLLPDAPREKTLLVAAAEAGLADRLREHLSQGMDPSTAIQLTASSFSASSPMTPEACRWVTSEIAAAMGITSPGDIGSAGATSGSAGQIGSGRLASGYSSEAPARDYARPPSQRVDSASAPRASAGEPLGAAQATGQAVPGSSPSAGGLPFAPAGGQVPGGQGAGGQGFVQPGSYNAGQPGNPAFPQAANLGFGQPQIQGNPQNYARGPVAGFQQPPGYPQPGYQSGVPAWPAGAPYPAQKTNSLAVAALVCGIVQFLGFWLLGTIPAIVFGHMARNQIRQRNEQGAGLALAGLILGYVGVALSVILVIIIIIAAVHSSQSTGY
jgi:Domain of unknown function (DUF4190)